ncbi:MAG: exodeoxyribonuclease VII small subunit [Lachnospiraceae bacterium]|nr:exodeoxyribonuclease VII small subunit [Lachnospiraceae bacterium]
MPNETINNREPFNVDEALDRLEAINKRLAEENIPLNEALELYRQGAVLAERCRKQLEGVEKELITLQG